MTTKAPPASHLIQGIKAGNLWRIVVIDVARKTVGAAENVEIRLAVIDALTRAMHKPGLYTKGPDTWAVHTKDELIFLDMKNPSEAKNAWTNAFHHIFNDRKGL